MDVILALEGGATHTTAGVYDSAGRCLREAEGAPCNPVAYGRSFCVNTLQQLVGRLRRDTNRVQRIVAGISGAVSQSIRQEIAQQLQRVTGADEVWLTTDLYPMLHVNAENQSGILAIAGTGSSVLAQRTPTKWIKVGGRGALFGDEGSAYDIVIRALRETAHAVDGLGPETLLLSRFMEAARVEDFEHLSAWTATASKSEIAALSDIVAQAAEAEDMVAVGCIELGARQLAQQVLVAHLRLSTLKGNDGDGTGETVSGTAHEALNRANITSVFMHGGMLQHCTLYRKAFIDALAAYSDLRATWPAYKGHHALYQFQQAQPDMSMVAIAYAAEDTEDVLPTTERRNVQERYLDEMDADEIVAEMNHQDATVATAVSLCKDSIAAAIRCAATTLQNDGRIFYAGAGTSGRLGVLDASECPPTFGTAPERVVGLIAGGETALRCSVEGAEDDTEQALADWRACEARAGDILVGIAASGHTPYVRAMLQQAASEGVSTVLLCCNPSCQEGADIIIAMDTGPEVLTGSSRLKAGTATKMVLNMISTGAMALSGLMYKGLMVGMQPVNTKLRRRAVRIVATLADVSSEKSQLCLEKSDYHIAAAILMAKTDCDLLAAHEKLAASEGILRNALAS